MRNIFRSCLFVLLLVTVLSAGVEQVSAQVFPLDTVLYNGDPSRFINFVFVGDGFQSGQMGSYSSSVQASTNYLFSISPFSEYRNYFNVFAIEVPSVDAGADHPGTASDVTEPAHPVSSVNTYFNSSFDVSSIHRLLVATNSSAVFNVVLTNFPQYDQRMVLVNSPYYGGSGGSNAAASLNGSSNEILVHEIGHSFAGLQDEYWSGMSWETANMSQTSNPATVRWANWIGFSGVGVYQHCCGGSSATWYRPSNNCKMRSLNQPFCPVCKETILEKVHQLFGTPVLSSFPSGNSVTYCAQPIQFGIQTVKPIPNTLRVKWLLNGNQVFMNLDTITLQSFQLNNGTNTLIAEILDTTALTRYNPHWTAHNDSLTWTIQYNPAAPPSISPPGPAFICLGDSLILSSSAALSYNWSTGDTTQTIQVSNAGDYHVYINGCPDNSDTVNILVNANPYPVISTSGDSSFCIGDSITISSSPAVAYLWSNGGTNQSLVVYSGGTYSVNVSDSNGCNGNSDPITVTENSLPLIQLGNDTTLCASCTLPLDAGNSGSSFLWSNGASTQQITITLPGIYWVQVSDSNGCTSSDTITISLFVNSEKILPNAQSGITVFPNPSYGVFTLDLALPTASDVSIRVTSVAGSRIVYSGELINVQDRITEKIDLSGMAKGIYIVTVTCADRVYSDKLELK